MPLLVLGRGSAVFRFEATRKVGLRGKPDGSCSVPNCGPCQQVFERFGQAEGPDVFRWGATGQKLEFSLQLTLAHIHCRRHLPNVETMLVKMLIHDPFELLDEQVRAANSYAIILRIHRRELSIPAPG